MRSSRFLRAAISTAVLSLGGCSAADKPATRQPEKAAAPAAASIGTTTPEPSKTIASADTTPIPDASTPLPSDHEAFDFAKQLLDTADVYALSLDDAKILRGIVFGRHGRHFADDTVIKAYLAGRPWYTPDSTFTNARLNRVERANLDIIRGAEAVKHPFIQPGDLRYFRHAPVTVAMLGHHTGADWELMDAEIPAVLGHRFALDEDVKNPEQDWDPGEEYDRSIRLQKYFNDRYWYEVDSTTPPLTPLDMATRDTIRLARMLDAGLAVAPGMMHLFANTRMDSNVVRGVGIHDLRILRNEVFARRGRRFSTPWLQEYFKKQPWYHPRAEFTIADLSQVDSVNIAVITQAEQQFHEALSTHQFTQFSFDGIYPGTAREMRNEIFARHGRVFRDKRLQAYFESFPWYRRNAAFKESDLSAIERKNVALLLEYEERARGGMRYYAA